MSSRFDTSYSHEERRNRRETIEAVVVLAVLFVMAAATYYGLTLVAEQCR